MAESVLRLVSLITVRSGYHDGTAFFQLWRPPMRQTSPADVSVIIGAYNVENYIERAIHSALDQSGVAVEIVVVNDASTDNTLGIASRIKDPRVACINLSSNSGPSFARNTGIAAASAPWLAVLDGDDAFAPNRLTRCIARANSTNADIVVDNLEVRRESDKVCFPMFKPEKFARMEMLDLATFIRGNILLLRGWALGYLKPIFSAQFLRHHQLGYDPYIHIGEDYNLLATALACGARCAVEATCGYFYTVRSGSMSYRVSIPEIIHLINGDKKFRTKYPLDSAARRAQKWRSLSLNEALAYLQLVDALKQKDVAKAFKICASRPTATLHLWRPIWVRIQQLFD
jgi:succinoglycan biosynthesis protein ExoO